jgi:diguanylate cyclase (GGDEF)-like protein/PAS domain S-box-containing protein
MADVDFYKNLLDHLSDGVYFVDRNRTITYWNRGAEQLTGYSKEEVLGHRCWHNILRHVDGQGRQLCYGACPLIATIMDGRDREADVYLHHKDGHRVPVRIRTIAMRDDSGSIIGAVESFNHTPEDIAATIERLQREALLDPLTQIGNRRYIDQQLRAHLDELHRYHHPFGVLLMDINAFKQMNDTYGHLVGDKVLQMVANTLVRCVRASDQVGRWGGDEFLVVAQHVDMAALTTFAERMCFLVQQSFLQLDRQLVRVTISAGAALAEPGDTVESLLQRVDLRLYHSKATHSHEEPHSATCKTCEAMAISLVSESEALSLGSRSRMPYS